MSPKPLDAAECNGVTWGYRFLMDEGNHIGEVMYVHRSFQHFKGFHGISSFFQRINLASTCIEHRILSEAAWVLKVMDPKKQKKSTCKLGPFHLRLSCSLFILPVRICPSGQQKLNHVLVSLSGGKTRAKPTTHQNARNYSSLEFDKQVTTS